MGLLRQDLASVGANLLENFLLVVHMDADVIAHTAGHLYLGYFVDLNTLFEPKHPLGSIASGAGDFHLEHLLEESDGLVEIC